MRKMFKMCMAPEGRMSNLAPEPDEETEGAPFEDQDDESVAAKQAKWEQLQAGADEHGFAVFNPADADLIPIEKVVKATPPRETPRYKIIAGADGGDVVYRPKRVRANKGWEGFPFEKMPVSRILADGAILGQALQLTGAKMRSTALNAFNRFRQVHPEFTARTQTLGVNKEGETVFGLWKLRVDQK